MSSKGPRLGAGGLGVTCSGEFGGVFDGCFFIFVGDGHRCGDGPHLTNVRDMTKTSAKMKCTLDMCISNVAYKYLDFQEPVKMIRGCGEFSNRKIMNCIGKTRPPTHCHGVSLHAHNEELASDGTSCSVCCWQHVECLGLL